MHKHGTQTTGDRKRTTKTKTAQMYEDIIFWASLAAGFQRSTIAKVLDPIIREPLRKILRDKGVDPDQAWAEAQVIEEED
jgi:hypothetical protein